MFSTEGSIRIPSRSPFKNFVMSYRDIIILTKKIIVGIIVAVIPFLIFFIGLRIIQHF